LLLAFCYAGGKYLFVTSSVAWDEIARSGGGGPARGDAVTGGGRLAALVRLAGHADVRWHAWIVLAACGRLDAALIVYTLYYPARTLAGIRGKRRSGDV
jgi:hypothetical protein